VDPTSGLVVFVDTDSYQIKDGNNVYRCNVGNSEYLASEIHTKLCTVSRLSTCALSTFTIETDNFALAVIIFELLMNGVHPFSCRVLPSQDSVEIPSPTTNILNGQCAFFQNVSGITIPAYAPSIDMLPNYMKELFKRAFVDGHTNPFARPSPEEWYMALDKLQGSLKTCSTVSFHEYESSLMTCPWCVMEESRSMKPCNAPTLQNFCFDLNVCLEYSLDSTVNDDEFCLIKDKFIFSIGGQNDINW
jgi:DNA-binding helix-hairpin-helix protein with protein kinase domain